MKNNTLHGDISQLTIFGRLQFIPGEEYKIINIDKKSVKVCGPFKIIENNEVIELCIEIEKEELKKHMSK